MEKKLKIIIDNCPQNHKCPAVNVEHYHKKALMHLK